MKVAVIIAGEYRGFDVCSPTMGPLLHGHDIYVSTWDTSSHISSNASLSHFVTDISAQHIRYLLEGYNVVDVDVTHFDTAHWARQKYNMPWCNRIANGLQMVQSSGIRYDYVLVLRPDLYIRADTTINWSTIKENTIYTGWGGPPTTLSDIVIAGSYDTVVKCLSLSDSWDVSTYEWHSFLYKHITDKGVSTSMFSLPITFIMARPPLGTILNFDDAIENFNNHRHWHINQQISRYGRDYTISKWSKHLIDYLFLSDNTMIIFRTRDVISALRSLHQLYYRQHVSTPVYTICTSDARHADITYTLQYDIGNNTGVIQLRTVIPYSTLSRYPDIDYTDTIWEHCHTNFVMFIQQYISGSVVELSMTGRKLSADYMSRCAIDSWSVIDINDISNTDNTYTLVDMLQHNIPYISDIQTCLIHSYTLNRIQDPKEFIKMLASKLAAGVHHIFSVPDLDKMIHKGYANCLTAEHTIFLAEYYIDHLLTVHGFKIISKEYCVSTCSIFYVTVRSYKHEVLAIPEGKFEYNKSLFDTYIFHQTNRVIQTQSAMSDISGPIYLFGANIFTQALITYGLDTSRVVCIIDKDDNKCDKRLYGTDLTVSAPVIIRHDTNPVVIVHNDVYNFDVCAYLLSINMTTKVHFI